jgi:BolA family transcriptional regulator, general stress-responsive regulator
MITDSRQQLIYDRLTTALSPTYLEVIDEGWQHKGHVEEGAGHFAVTIASSQFKDKTLVACHRMVYEALSGIVGQTVHALRIIIQNPSASSD